MGTITTQEFILRDSGIEIGTFNDMDSLVNYVKQNKPQFRYFVVVKTTQMERFEMNHIISIHTSTKMHTGESNDQTSD